ncbi:MAG: PAS domain-containing sensor histidine kinase [Campylobacterota bacterium]|nr:PAS domain-containing sensor histidine kinase [Campylobacterota bacterium]
MNSDWETVDIAQYLNIVNDIFIISKTDHKGTITYVNDIFCKISGYSKEELIGQSHSKVRHPQVPSSVFKELWDTIKDGKTFKVNIRNRAKDGSSYVTEANIIPITNKNGEREYLSIRTDITQYALKKENDIIDASDKLKIIIDKNGSVVNFNKKAREDFRNIRKNAPIQDAIDDDIFNKPNVDILFENKIDNHIIKYNSKTYSIEVESFLEEYVINFTDISNVVELQNKHNKEILKNKDKMLVVFTHELKTPLNGIIGFSEILSKRLNRGLKKEITNNDIVSYMKITDDINALGHKLNSSVISLLDSAKLKNGQYTLSKSNFNLSDLLKDQIAIMRRIYPQDIKFDLDDCEIYSDKNSIEQIFSNIFSNALKYGDKKVYISLKQTNDTFELAIEDNGNGIAPANRSKIFEIFEQLDDKELTRNVEGTGIGMHFVKLLCDLLEYTIDIKKSDKLGGASFIVSGKIK